MYPGLFSFLVFLVPEDGIFSGEIPQPSFSVGLVGVWDLNTNLRRSKFMVLLAFLCPRGPPSPCSGDPG